MSWVTARQIRCPHCLSRFEAPTFASLHVRKAPEVREAVLAGEFERVVCDACGGSVAIERPMLYTDFERFHFMALMPTPSLVHRESIAAHVAEVFRRNFVAAAPPMVQDWAPRFHKRVVFGVDHLREKLLCFEHDVDDRALEVLKVWLLRDLAPEWFDWRADAVLQDLSDDSFTILFSGPVGADGTQVVRVESVPRSQLARAAQALPAFDGLADWVVDWRALLAPSEPLEQPFEHLAQDVVYDRLPTS